VAPQTAKRGIPRSAVVLLTIAVVIALGFWWWKFKPASIFLPANPAAATSKFDFQKLTGRWQRPDGGYILAIKSIADNGAMEAGYFNPKSIHVGKAEASRDGDATKVFIELRDVNYPGSTYSLTYDQTSDQLKGIYYQAVERQRFEVGFVRMK
ncbi:MAG: hypothetical protein ACREP5_15635, partial [Candidatus Binatia bacterium]